MFSDPLSQLPPPAWRWSLPSLAAQQHALPRLHHELPPRKLDWATLCCLLADTITRSGRNKQPSKSSQSDHRWLWHLAKYIEASCSVLKLAYLIAWMLQILPPAIAKMVWAHDSWTYFMQQAKNIQKHWVRMALWYVALLEVSLASILSASFQSESKKAVCTEII